MRCSIGMLRRNIHMEGRPFRPRKASMPGLAETLVTLAAQRDGGRRRSAGPSRLRSITDFGPNPGQLVMKVRVPASRSARSPLVIALHGCTQSAENYAGESGWLDLADRFGFVVITPEQTRSNNQNLCFNWYEPGDTRHGLGEAASIAAMVSYAIRTFDVDEERVFVTGLSAGGAMASVMLANYPGLFAGGAIVAGLAYGVANSLGEALSAMSQSQPRSPRELGAKVRGATAHAGPWPYVSVWHGQSDGIVRPMAGEAVAQQWCDVHGVAEPAQTARTPDGRDFLVWLSAAGEPVVELHRVAGMGHGVPVKAGGPNGCGKASTYSPEVGISSSLEIALSWGIADVWQDVSGVERPVSENSRSHPADPDTTDRISGIIQDALRAAGLMR